MCVSGRRDEVAAVLSGMADQMPGCLQYVVAEDRSDPDALWVTEIWVDQEHHQQSLALPVVQEAIATCQPMMTGFGHRFETTPYPSSQ